MSKEESIDFGELVNSEKFTSAIQKLNTNLDGTKAMLELIAKCDVEKLSVKDQVMVDLYMAFAINSLYWMFLRTKGINPATQAIKSEITRVRECVGRANKVHNRKQPKRLNKDAAKRFIRSGLWQPGEKPAGGVIKKFSTNAVEENASTATNNINEKGGKTKQFKAPNDCTEGGVKKVASINVVQVNTTTALNNINEKGGETKFKAPNGNSEGDVKKVSSTNVGEVKASSSFSKVNMKGSYENKSRKTREEKQTEEMENRRKAVAYMNDPYNLSRTCRELSMKILEMKRRTVKSEDPNGIAEGVDRKFDPTNTVDVNPSPVLNTINAMKK